MKLSRTVSRLLVQIVSIVWGDIPTKRKLEGIRLYPAFLKQLRMGYHHRKLFKGMDSCLLPNAASICLLVK